MLAKFSRYTVYVHVPTVFHLEGRRPGVPPPPPPPPKDQFSPEFLYYNAKNNELKQNEKSTCT